MRYRVMVKKSLTGEILLFTEYSEGLQAFKCINRMNFTHGHTTGDLYYVEEVTE